MERGKPCAAKHASRKGNRVFQGVLAPPLTTRREKVQIKYRKLAGNFGVVLRPRLKGAFAALYRIAPSGASILEKRTICLYAKDDLVSVSPHFLKKGTAYEKGFLVFFNGRVSIGRRRSG